MLKTVGVAPGREIGLAPLRDKENVPDMDELTPRGRVRVLVTVDVQKPGHARPQTLCFTTAAG